MYHRRDMEGNKGKMNWYTIRIFGGNKKLAIRNLLTPIVDNFSAVIQWDSVGIFNRY
jgi:hypothetical protein